MLTSIQPSEKFVFDIPGVFWNVLSGPLLTLSNLFRLNLMPLEVFLGYKVSAYRK
jgi:hypothetical protein